MVAASELLRAERIGRRLDEGWIWRNLSFRLEAGRVLGLCGPSGAGKSLLLRALSGLDPLDEGAISLEGAAPLSAEMPKYRARVAYLSQRPAVFEGSVEENLRRPFRLAVHAERRFDRSQLLRWLTALGRGESFFELRAQRLSGGERQLMALLRTLQMAPLVLLLDEPTAALDPKTSEAVEDLLRDFLAAGPARSCIWTSHDAAQIARVAQDRLTLEPSR